MRISYVMACFAVVCASSCGTSTMCGAGTKLTGSTCAPNCGAGTQLDGASGTCIAEVMCGAGTQAANGQCVLANGACATGTHLSGLTCVADAICGTGTHDISGICVPDDGCGAGTHDVKGTCLPDDLCGSGTHDVGGACIPNDSCGPGTHDISGSCVPDDRCGAGTHDQNGTCISNLACGTGTHAVGGACAANDACGPGTHDVNGECAPTDSCGTGTKDMNGVCVPVNSPCGVGTHLDMGSNSCLPDVTCGAHTRVYQGQCILDLGGHGATQWSANVQVSPTGAGDGTALIAYEPQLAVSQTNGQTNVAIVYPTWHGAWDGYNFASSQIVTAVSHDGGKSFPKSYIENSSDQVFNAPAWLGDPTILVHGLSVSIVFVAYRSKGCDPNSVGGLCGDLYFDNSQDGGDTWAGPQTLLANSTTFIDRPFWSSGLDGNDYLSFTWSKVVNGRSVRDTYLIRVDGNGNTTQMNNTLDSGHGAISQAPVVATAQGRIFGSLDIPGGMYHLAEVVNAPSNDAAPFSLITTRQTEQSRDNGLSFLNQWIAMNPSGEMSLVWRYNFSGSTRIAITTTTNGVWPIDVRAGHLVDDAPVAVNCAYPFVTADEKGRWQVLWQDNRYGAWGTYSSSSDNGTKWSPSSRVSDKLFVESGWINPKTMKHDEFLGDYNSMAAAYGQLFASWVDTRNGASQVFFSSAPNP